MRAEYRPTGWWRHSLTLGVDRMSSDYFRREPQRLTPDDTLMLRLESTQRRTSIAYNTSVNGTLTPGLQASATVGVDHFNTAYSSFFALGAITTDPLVVAPGQPTFPAYNRTTNTGYFVQTQLNLRDALFLTGALRADAHSEFGEDLGTPLSPRVGVSFVRQLAATTVKLRAAYGEAIRPPAPGLKNASASGGVVWLANAELRPERQVGPDVGVDLVFGRYGSLSVSYYDQTLRDVIQSVTLEVGSPELRQNQNLARAKNKGWEFEGSLTFDRLSLRGQYAVMKSYPVELGSEYTGDLRVGEQFYFQPRHTAGLTLTAAPLRRTSLSASLAYTGARSEYDYLAYYRCLGGTGPCLNDDFGLTEYIAPYSGYVTVNVSVEQQLSRTVTGYLGVENLTNPDAMRAFNNAFATPRRITTVGLRVRG